MRSDRVDKVPSLQRLECSVDAAYVSPGSSLKSKKVELTAIEQFLAAFELTVTAIFHLDPYGDGFSIAR
jgi:hypothetical protein